MFSTVDVNNVFAENIFNLRYIKVLNVYIIQNLVSVLMIFLKFIIKKNNKKP